MLKQLIFIAYLYIVLTPFNIPTKWLSIQSGTSKLPPPSLKVSVR